MLKSIRLQNFFGFQDCTINLEKGANVLVGINGSGKSNFFKAIRLLKQMQSSDGITDLLYSQYGGLENIFFARKKIINNPFDCKVTVLVGEPNNEPPLDYHSYLYSYTLHELFAGQFALTEDLKGYNKEGEEQLVKFDKGYKIWYGKGSPEEFPYDLSKSIFSGDYNGFKSIFWYELRNYLIDFFSYDNIDTSRFSLIRKPNPPRLDKYLLADGSNLASLLNEIKLTDKETYNRIVGALKSVNENFIGIEFKQLSGFIEMWLEEDGLNRAISPIHISDGTLKFLCLMAILYNPNRGSVVCIDEPELGLHPDMINTLHEAIEFASETSQIIISTHSAHLLNYFDIEQVRVFEKDENNATIVNQFSKKEFAGWNQKFQTGKAWREGVIGGKRW